MAEAKKTTYKKNLLRKVIDPLDGIKIKKGTKRKALDEIAEFLESAILDRVLSAKSPVSKEGWKSSLSKSYQKIKGRSAKADMVLTSSMMNSMKTGKTQDGKVFVEFTGKQAEKADGHSHLTDRDSKLPRRRILPDEEQKFSQPIDRGIKAIVDKFKVE